MEINVTYGENRLPLSYRFETDVVGPKSHATVDVSVQFVPYGLTDDGGPAGHNLDLSLHWAMVTMCGPDQYEPSSLEDFYWVTGFNGQSFGEAVLRNYYDHISDMADVGD